MVYEKVSFDVNVILKFNSLEEFINHISYQHLWPGLSEEKRKERLKEVHWIVTLLKPENLNVGNYGNSSTNAQ